MSHITTYNLDSAWHIKTNTTNAGSESTNSRNATEKRDSLNVERQKMS